MISVPALLRDVTFLTALYGALVATVVAALQWHAHRRDRRRVRLDAAVQQAFDPTPPDSAFTRVAASEPQIVFTVTNIGRRPVRITHFGVRFGIRWGEVRKRRREFLTQPRPELPLDLTEGETCELRGPSFAGQVKLPDATAVFVCDSLGHRWERHGESLGQSAGRRRTCR